MDCLICKWIACLTVETVQLLSVSPIRHRLLAGLYKGEAAQSEQAASAMAQS
uniref:Transcriptional regulator n=1 Tax=Steinernema glaseri TaxID=37863 RepID=A0A1I7XYK5_9BILA